MTESIDPAHAPFADRVVFILIQPQQSGNVGAAARAMKNMGLYRLILVDPPAFDPHRARWMAPGCDDIIAGIKVVKTLDEALVGVHRVIASTARHRRHDQPVLEPKSLGHELWDDSRTTAILFGREDTGLSTHDVARAEAILRIPTPEYASLNLGQAVLLVSYGLFEAGRELGWRPSGRPLGGQRGSRSTTSMDRPEPPATIDEIEAAVQSALQMLAAKDYPAPPEKIAVTLRSLLQRAVPTSREVGALRGMIKRFYL